MILVGRISFSILKSSDISLNLLKASSPNIFWNISNPTDVLLVSVICITLLNVSTSEVGLISLFVVDTFLLLSFTVGKDTYKIWFAVCLLPFLVKLLPFSPILVLTLIRFPLVI